MGSGFGMLGFMNAAGTPTGVSASALNEELSRLNEEYRDIG